MPKISLPGCLSLSPAISSQFTLKMCVQPKIAKNSLKTLSGSSRSCKVIDVNRSKKPVASACYDNHVSICNRFHATRANSSKITTFYWKYPSLSPACVGLIELRESGLGRLKCTINSKNFICRLSGSIFSIYAVVGSIIITLSQIVCRVCQ